MTLSPEKSPILRGVEVESLPLASLIAVDDRPNPAVIAEVVEESDCPDPGPTTDELVSQAYQSGFDEGVAAAESAIRATFAATVEALDASARDLAAARAAWENVGPGHTVDIALDIAEMILMREVATSSDPGRDAIVRCLSEVARDEAAVIRISPSDLAQLGPFEDLLVDRSFELVGDPAITNGDAVADTTTGSVDARLRGALGRVREELLR